MMFKLLHVASFATLDWAVLGGYFGLLAVTGWILSLRKQADTGDYFLGGRDMPTWAVAFSIVATALSAATFLGAPEASYKGNLTYLSMFIGNFIAIIIVARVFIPVFYRYNVETVYQLVTVKVGDRAGAACGWMFMVGRVFASGSRIFMAAIPAGIILFGDPTPGQQMLAIAVMTVVGIAYTVVGGIRSVIWSDVIQLVVFVGAAVVALAVLAGKIPVGFTEAIDVLHEPAPGESSKLTVLTTGFAEDDSIDFTQTFTLLTTLTGFVLLNIAAYGTDHDMAQRMLTCRTPGAGARSAIYSLLLNIPITALFLAVGLGLYIFYSRPDLMGDQLGVVPPNSGSEKIFANFIISELPAGVKGLAIAGLFAAGLSSLNSALNAMSASFVNDWYRRIRPVADEQHYLRVGRIAVCVWGVILGSFACFCVLWQAKSGEGLINFALSVMTFAYSGLAAVFLTLLFTKRGSSASVIGALVVGFLVILAFKLMGLSENAEGVVGFLKTLAFPWQLCMATGFAFFVCVVGKRKVAGHE